MTRGQAAQEGSTRISKNGYHYTKTPTGWKLTQRILAECEILGRELEPDERVKFVDGNKLNFDLDNLVVVKKKSSPSVEKQRAHLQARIEELQAQLDLLDEQ